MNISILSKSINDKITEEHESGVSRSALSKRYGVTSSMISYRIKKARSMRKVHGEFYGLSVRAFNALTSAGFKSKKDVVDKFLEDPSYFRKLRNFGNGCFSELESFVIGETDENNILKKIAEAEDLLSEIKRLVIETKMTRLEAGK